MEKLIKLLKEYDKINGDDNKWYINMYGRLDRGYGWATVTSSCRKVISKGYGFIERLVDNDKTDDEKIKNARKEIGEVIDYFYKIHGAATRSLLMLLSISDNPIEELLLYLK